MTAVSSLSHGEVCIRCYQGRGGGEIDRTRLGNLQILEDQKALCVVGDACCHCYFTLRSFGGCLVERCISAKIPS